MQKTYDALLPSGDMHLSGEMLDDDRRGPLDAALWGLFEVMSNSTGITHTRAIEGLFGLSAVGGEYAGRRMELDSQVPMLFAVGKGARGRDVSQRVATGYPR